jgi:hypothetical protein
MILRRFKVGEDLVKAIFDQVLHKCLFENSARSQYWTVGKVLLRELARMELDIINVAPATPFGNSEDGVDVESTVELG